MPFSAEIEPPREATRENTAARGRKITGQIEQEPGRADEFRQYQDGPWLL